MTLSHLAVNNIVESNRVTFSVKTCTWKLISVRSMALHCIHNNEPTKRSQFYMCMSFVSELYTQKLCQIFMHSIRRNPSIQYCFYIHFFVVTIITIIEISMENIRIGTQLIIVILNMKDNSSFQTQSPHQEDVSLARLYDYP